MARFTLTIANGSYQIVNTEGTGFLGATGNLACSFDDEAETLKMTDKAWRNWMPIFDGTADDIEVNDDEMTYSELKEYLNSVIKTGGGGGGGSASWGDIGGDIDDQTDLQQALDGKQDTLTAGSNITIVNNVISATGGGGGGGANWGEIGGTLSNQTDLANALNSKANSSHTHQQSDVSGLSTALGGKANSVHSHAVSDVTNLQSALDGKQAKQTFTANTSTPSDSDFVLMQASSETGTTAILKRAISKVWDYIKGKADLVYATISHSHSISEITNLQTTLNGKQSTLTFDDTPTAGSSNPVKSSGVKSALDGKANSSHSHSQSEVDGLSTALAGKASSTHSHAISDVTDLQTTLNGKASSTHSHSISDVTNLQTALDGKASSSHSHSISDVTNLQSSLDGKAPSTHSHTISEITNLQSTLNGKFEETESGGSGIAPYLCEIKATISGGSLSFASDQVENLRKMFASMYTENKARHICVLTITGGSTTPLTLCSVDLRSYSSTGGSAKFVNTTDYTEILITYANNAVTSTIEKLFWVGTTTQYNALSSGVKNSGKPFFTTD